MLAVTADSELDAGPKASGLERFCIVTREAKPADDMLRFVVAPDGHVVADLKRNLPGRGLWLTATREALKEAVKRKAFARGFKREVRLPAGFVEETDRLLERAALDALSIVGKAGQAVTGFAKVEAAIARYRIAAIVHAADGAPDGIRKVDAAARAQFGDDMKRIHVIRAFTSAQLDLALGRSNVVHAALLAGAATDTFIARFSRLERFRTGNPGGRG
ncbi:MAG: RNA-binding protein [Pseudorhodoplanes sp.]